MKKILVSTSTEDFALFAANDELLKEKVVDLLKRFIAEMIQVQAEEIVSESEFADIDAFSDELQSAREMLELDYASMSYAAIATVFNSVYSDHEIEFDFD